MSTLAIELNDVGITPLGDDDRSPGGRFSSPGYAIVDGSAIVTGAEALGQARLKPRRVHHRFWSRLDTQPVGRPFPADLSSADLAHAHLSSVWERVRSGVDRVIIALPGSHSEQQMGLILGIAQACGIPVEGVVDAAVAAATTVSPRGRVVHLDIELNGIVLTEIAGGRELVRRKVQLGDHTGWVRLRDAWAKCVARNFVSRTRFDPLHLAATEQVLYARLEELLPRLCRMPRATVELEAGGRVHTVEIEGTDLVDSVAPDYDGLLQLTGRLAGAGEPATLLLSDRMAGLPGLSDRLADVAGSDVVCLPAAAAASGALRHAEGARTQGDGVPYITRLTLMGSKPAPVIDGPKPPVALVRADARTLPTHVLHDGTAYPITDEPFALGSSNVQCRIRRSGGRVIVEPLGSHGSFLNGRRVEGATAVERGDRLRVGASGVEMQFIAVADDDATPRD